MRTPDLNREVCYHCQDLLDADAVDEDSDVVEGVVGQEKEEDDMVSSLFEDEEGSFGSTDAADAECATARHPGGAEQEGGAAALWCHSSQQQHHGSV